MRIENRINKIEEKTGMKRKGPDKIIFEVIGENGQVVKTIETQINYEKNTRKTEKD